MTLEKPCLEWTDGRYAAGYGAVRIGGRSRYVHQIVWSQDNGPVPEGMVVRHLCHNPPCYEISHLTIGTQGQNMRDSADDGRLGKRSLDWELVTQRYRDGEEASAIAESMGCARRTIQKIVTKMAPELTASRRGGRGKHKTWANERALVSRS